MKGHKTIEVIVLAVIAMLVMWFSYAFIMLPRSPMSTDYSNNTNQMENGSIELVMPYKKEVTLLDGSKWIWNDITVEIPMPGEPVVILLTVSKLSDLTTKDSTTTNPVSESFILMLGASKGTEDVYSSSLKAGTYTIQAHDAKNLNRFNLGMMTDAEKDMSMKVIFKK